VRRSAQAPVVATTAKATGIAKTVQRKKHWHHRQHPETSKRILGSVNAFPSRGNTVAQKCPMCGQLATCREPSPSRRLPIRRGPGVSHTYTCIQVSFFHRRIRLHLLSSRSCKASLMLVSSGSWLDFVSATCSNSLGMFGRVRPEAPLTLLFCRIPKPLFRRCINE
jgi:hypothetical protein